MQAITSGARATLRSAASESDTALKLRSRVPGIRGTGNPLGRVGCRCASVYKTGCPILAIFFCRKGGNPKTPDQTALPEFKPSPPM